MRTVACLLAGLLASGLVFAAQPRPEKPAPELQSARETLATNLALGDGVAGKPVTPEQAAEANRLVDEGLASARAYAKEQPESAEAHHLIGMFLAFAYRPAPLDAPAGAAKQQVAQQTLRRGGKQSLLEGVGELRAAMRLAPRNTNYQLDYSGALALSGEGKRAIDLVGVLWRRTDMAKPQRERAARIAAGAARDLRQPYDEQRWLEELLAINPKDEAAQKRLAEMPASAAVPPSTAPIGAAKAAMEITWQDYQAALSQARREGKPIMIDFMTSWCGWCKKLDSEVYTKPDVIDMSKRFVCVKVNAEERSDLARVYGVTGYPTIVFLDSVGRETNRVNGYVPAQGFLERMRKSLPPK